MAESGEFREKKCFEIFTEILGRKRAAKHWKEMYLCILAVDCGFKTSYLLDQCSLQPVQMNKLITKLGEKELISRDDLLTVVIYGDIFVLQIEKTLEHVNRILNERYIGFIDVSQRLNAPEILCNTDENFWSMIKLFCLKFVDFLQRCELDIQNGDVFVQGSFEFDKESPNPCTIFGILLGYPVVYCMTKDSEINCLSETDLTVYASEIAVQSWQGKNGEFVMVCSFSFPANLSPHCDKYIESWKDSVTAISKKQIKLIHRINRKQVRLPIVIL